MLHSAAASLKDVMILVKFTMRGLWIVLLEMNLSCQYFEKFNYLREVPTGWRLLIVIGDSVLLWIMIVDFKLPWRSCISKPPIFTLTSGSQIQLGWGTQPVVTPSMILGQVQINSMPIVFLADWAMSPLVCGSLLEPRTTSKEQQLLITLVMCYIYFFILKF